MELGPGPLAFALYAAVAVLYFGSVLAKFLHWQDRALARAPQAPLRLVFLFVRMAADAVLWPTGLLKRRPEARGGTPRLRWEEAQAQLHPTMAAEAIALVAVVLGLFGAQLWVGSGSWVFRWTYWMVLSATAVRLASYAFGHKPAELLRRSRVRPAVHFLGVTAGTYVTIVVCLLGPAVEGDASRLTAERVGAVISRLNVGSWMSLAVKLASRELVRPDEAAHALIGVLVNVALIKSLFKVKELRRRKEDYLALAQACLVTLQVEEAARWCARVKEHERDQGWLVLMQTIALAQGALDEALAYAFALGTTLNVAPSPDLAYRVLARSGQEPAVPVDQVRRLLQRWIFSGDADDAHLCSSMGALSWRLSPLEPSEALWPWEDRYPLTQAQLHVAVGEREAASRLIGSLDGLSSFGELERLRVLLGAGPDWRATLRDPRTCEALRGFLAGSLDRVRGALPGLRDALERSLALQSLQVIATRAGQLDAPEAGEYRALLPALLALVQEGGERRRLEGLMASFPALTALHLEREAAPASRERRFHDTYVRPYHQHRGQH